ncbi:5-formyltetrahydrofolate cyclo-ligase [Novispirillum sp. DQ9]|uniref:5-formyltetrahydrofolate cyclo-ligase n=1 Tax=Novispirillum sp. DQ9 TaxID=3398612 RepID=UPI003C7BFD5B
MADSPDSPAEPLSRHTKGELRARILALREMLGALAQAGGGQSAEDALRTRVLESAPLPPGAVVAGYWPMRGEIDVLPLLGALAGRGQVTALPAVVGRREPLEFRRWAPGDVLEDGLYGTRHPVASAGVVRPVCLLVPLLAFDRRGIRLGYGGGFYDRTLAALRADGPVVAVGVAYAGQEVEALPVEPHDERLDWVVTEKEVIRINDERQDA